MDIIAFVFQGAPESVEIRRMDWAKVNSITVDAPVCALCFSPDGKTLCIATSNKVMLYEIEHSQLLSTRITDCEIVCVHIGESNGTVITIISCVDGTISLFCDFHFALSTFILPTPAHELSLIGTSVYALHEDGRELSHFEIPSMESQSTLINSIAKVFSTYWINYQKIENAHAQLEDTWKRIWEEASIFSSRNEELAKAFLCGLDPPEISTDSHRIRLAKSIAQELADMKSIIANTIIPAFTKLDEASRKLKAGVEICPQIGIEVDDYGSPRQIKNCFMMIRNIQLLEKCFATLFQYLQDSRSFDLSVSTTEFADFLANYLTGFPLLDLRITKVPTSTPMFEAVEKEELVLPGRFSAVSGSKWTCLSSNVKVFDAETGETEEFDVDGTPLAAYSFDDDTVGCFYENDEMTQFVLLNGENDTPRGVELVDATSFVISPRRIAFVLSAQLFCSVVDLDSGGGDAEEEEEG